ncbi:polysaccharide deacetylase family protein [Geminicoccaceae bacterium 1502E]|nr:polysaccharide deacetylase family protein [Geminicoccaceae bacterium 1502E]
MNAARARALLFELYDEAASLAGRYPRFVTRDVDRLPPGEVPVFTFHTIEPEPFEAQLAHLARNGYRTVDSEALLRHLTGAEALPPRSVMLTIDDGRKSVWTFGFPLLRRYGFKATVFLIPGYAREAEETGPTLADAWEGRVPARSLRVEDPQLMSWAEIRAMDAAGVADFQSHTLYHHRVPVSGRVTGFLGPQPREAFFDLPVPAGTEARLLADGPQALLGLPIFETAPVSHGRPRHHPPEGLVEECLAGVRAAGGVELFARPDAAAVLRRIFGEAVQRHGPGLRETHEEAEAALRRDLERSRLIIEEKLGGRPCRHLCYPYHAGSAVADRLAREAGYRSAFWGPLRHRAMPRAGTDPMRIPRVKNDYLHRLPGEGRRPLAAILGDKLRRRHRGGAVY